MKTLLQNEKTRLTTYLKAFREVSKLKRSLRKKTKDFSKKAHQEAALLLVQEKVVELMEKTRQTIAELEFEAQS